MNKTQNATDAINIIGIDKMVLIIGSLVFVSVIVVLFLVFKNFRRTFFGAVISLILLGLYKFSAYIGISASNGDYVPVKWYIYVVCFLIISIIIGYILDKFGFMKKIDEFSEKMNKKEDDKDD